MQNIMGLEIFLTFTLQNQFDVVIEILVLKQLEDRKTHWINEGYEAPEMSEECEIRKEETFKVGVLHVYIYSFSFTK